MTENIEIKIIIDPSLRTYFEEGMSERHITCSTEVEITEFLASILNDTMYPISSRLIEDQIHLNHRPRSFADPIF